MKTLSIKSLKTYKELETKVKTDNPDYIIGSIKDLKKLNLDQSSQVLGIQVIPDAEEIQLKDFKDRQTLDNHIKALLGDNLTLNRRNKHRLVGKIEDLDRLMLSETSEIYGLKVKV